MNGKALIIGWGSIGKQHQAALAQLGFSCAVVTKQQIDLPNFLKITDAVKDFKPEYVIVANETSRHFSALQELASMNFSGHVLIEKPLFDSLHTIPANTFAKIGVGYQLRFHPALQALHSAIENEKVLSCHCYCGQYLPSWRPDTDYRISYSASRAKGGGVLRDLSHEIDYLLWLFGEAKNVKALGGKYSSLEITSEDTVGCLMALERCPVVTLQMNYLDRIGRREIVVNTERETFVVDFRNASLRSAAGGERIFPVQKSELLVALHENFLGEGNESFCGIQEGVGVLKVIEEIEREFS